MDTDPNPLEDTGAFTPIVAARCCRDWPVGPYWPLGRCGLCGRVPWIGRGEDVP